MRIDSHQHFWAYDPARFAWLTEDMRALRRDFLPEHLRPELAAAGIDATVAVQVDQSESETRFLLDLARANPEIAGVVGWVDLRAENLPERLEYFSQFDALAGFRHIAQSEPDARFLLRDDFLRGIGQLQSFDFTYDILIYPRHLPAAVELVARFPKQRFVVDHLAKPLIKSGGIESWARSMRQIAAHENVFCKLSGMVTEADWSAWKPADFAPYLDVVFEAFGVDRLMFGSDWPVCLVAASYAQVKQLVEDYAASDRDRIFGSNAARFYGLSVLHGSRAQ
ncbi:MAG TPA: amidohydrolase family protein [Bryobacteraceae bacterium]|nr:amidohydrolase family protein [Bryobacteraceae bacterium]